MYFVVAHREWRLSLRKETVPPYGAAHNATAHPNEGYLQQDTVEAILNLAIATAIDCAAISQLTAMVKRLTAYIVTVNAKLITALQPQQASQGGHVG